MSRFLELTLAATLAATPVLADGFGLGRDATPDEVAAWDIDVRPDGQGLPEGRGTVAEGEEIFTAQCAVCHGDFGEGVGRWPNIAGGQGSLADEDPVKTVGSYWPYLSTVWDYVHRAMPFGNAQSLTDDEVYALTAYILYLNDVVLEEDFELSHENFTEIRLENEDGFYMDDRDTLEVPQLTGEPCMEACKPSVEITMRARVLDVTPDTADDDAAAAPAAETAAAEPAPEAPAEESVAALDPELVAAGERAFRQCSACHQIGEGATNRVGPHLNDLFGRTAGEIDGFNYSRPFQEAGEAGLVWNDETIAAFLADPRNYVKGTRMSFRGLKSEDDAAAILAYLKSFDE
ncbi:c-type cytochrome [Halovulum dunhuangense]|uniref:C-type cytochrome n=1 Tax=Halovulum dunhuangense TaxID=1505036 RepID=A0A849KVV4_9RHOB|nr:c-type cytochrome [Halovulum dunhuangense]NNU79255.1 c-type cytochrome [Halovulum dunhuangense]